MAVRRDGAAHPSPNAGRCEAAFAGALGVSLGGTNVYQGRAERRGTLGDGPPPKPADLDRAIRLSRLITAAAAVLAALTASLLPTLIHVCGRWHSDHKRMWSLAQRPQTNVAAGTAGAGVMAAGRAAGAGVLAAGAARLP